uniref:Uncharacterized protein n=1 Tax=Tanacetum cinerariifolium TaxID=118510 RepID=A0A6L2MJ59_TANCI|nr:hypothetical protein [Tanacetum cinerariifolium]
MLRNKDIRELTFEKFEGLFKNLSRLLDSQQSDKSNTVVGYDSQGVDSQVLENQVNDKYNICEGYHAIPPLYTGNYVPPKPDLVFVDEHVVSESATSLPDITKSEVKTSETKLKNVSAPIIEDWVSDSEDEDAIKTEHPFSRAVVSVNTTRPINTAYPRLTVNGAKPSLNVLHKSQSPVRRTFNQRTTPQNSDLKETVNTANINNVTTAGTKAVVCAVQGNRENVVKSSACWIWIPTRNVIDHISKHSGSYMLKRFNYVDLRGRLKSAMAWVKTVNEDVWLQALVDGKKVIVNEASIRRDLRLDDAEGSTNQGGSKGRKQRFLKMSHQLRNIYLHLSYDPLPSGEDRLQLNELMEICTKLSDRVLSLEQIKTNQAAKIEKLKKRVKKLEAKKKKRNQGLKRLYKVGLSTRGESSNKEGLGDQEDASKQGRIAEIDANEDLSLINETTQDKGKMNDQERFGVNDLDGDDIVVDVSAGEKEEQISAALTTTTTTDDELNLAQTLIEIKVAKPKAITTAAITVTAVSTRPMVKGIIMQEPFETPSSKPIFSSQQPSYPKDKGKAKMVEPKRPLKRKEQIIKDEQIARDLKAQMQADLEEEQRIQAFNKTIDWINNFVAMDSEAVKDRAVESSKRLGEELESDKSKKQKLDENVQAKVADDDTTELKRCTKIVPEDDDEVTIEATPLSSKSPTIADYKIYKKTRFEKTKPVNDMDNLLFQTLKTMFEHQVEDNIWKYQRGAVKVSVT